MSNNNNDNNTTTHEAFFSIRVDYNRAEDGGLDTQNTVEIQNCSLEEVQTLLCNVILPKLGIFAELCIPVEFPIHKEQS